jgi:hypothetical protein
MVLLNNHLNTLPDLSKHGTEIARKFRFGHAEDGHASIIALVITKICPSLISEMCYNS